MIQFPRDTQQIMAEALGATVRVVGVGGAGSNVVDRMSMDGADGVELLTLNTDARALMNTVTAERIQLGAKLTRGLGSGGDPELGAQAAAEASEEIATALEGRRLVFVCAGLGGGTGSGATPTVCRVAREAGAMVIAFVMLPFRFEGGRRLLQARNALEALRQESDAVIVFENDRMGEVALATDGVQKAFEAADRLVGGAIRGVASLVARPGLIRIGLDDLLAVLRASDGHCLFGHGIADGENRAKSALEKALHSPLLDRGKLLQQADGVLVHVAGGKELRLFEVQTLMGELGRHVPEHAQLFFGMAVDPALKKTISVTIFSSLSHEVEEEPEPEPELEEALLEPAADEAEPTEPTPEASPKAEAESAAPEPEADLDADPEASDLPAHAEEPSPPAVEEEVLEDVEGAGNPEPQPVAEPELEPEPEAEVDELHETDPLPEIPRVEPLTANIPLSKKPRKGEDSTRVALHDIIAPKDSGGQGELPLGKKKTGKGGRFENTDPTLVDGEDMDLPTFLRRKKRR